MKNLLRLAIVGVLFAFAVIIIGLGMARNTGDLMAPVNLLLFAIAVAVYLLPTALAVYRDCTATVWITLLNVFLGWTILGWFVAIGWAAGGKAEKMPSAVAAPLRPAAHVPAAHVPAAHVPAAHVPAAHVH